jgi:hypothetical protein
MLARAVRIAVVVAILGLVVTLALAFRRDPHDIKTGTIGRPAPVFTLDRLDGSGTVALADFSGKVVVVNFLRVVVPAVHPGESRARSGVRALSIERRGHARSELSGVAR